MAFEVLMVVWWWDWTIIIAFESALKVLILIDFSVKSPFLLQTWKYAPGYCEGKLCSLGPQSDLYMFYTHGCIFTGPNPYVSNLEITIKRFLFSKSRFKSVLWITTLCFWRYEAFQSKVDFSSKLIMYWPSLLLC